MTGPWHHLGIILAVAMAGCANPCERLCEAYYELNLRCTLVCWPYQGGDQRLCHEDGTSTGEEEPTPPDENNQIQLTEYQIQQCQADYAELGPATAGQPSEAASCQTWVGTLEGLLDQYNKATDDATRYTLCDEFYTYEQEMNLAKAR